MLTFGYFTHYFGHTDAEKIRFEKEWEGVVKFDSGFSLGRTVLSLLKFWFDEIVYVSNFKSVQNLLM